MAGKGSRRTGAKPAAKRAKKAPAVRTTKTKTKAATPKAARTTTKTRATTRTTTAPPPSERGARGGRKRHYEGPLEWLVPMMESAYAKLVPRERAEEVAEAPPRRRERRRGTERPPTVGPAFAAAVEANAAEEMLATPPRDHWLDAIREFQRRKSASTVSPRAVLRGAEAEAGPAQPAIPGMNNWTPLGPYVVARGQAVGRPAVSGRVSGIAIAPGGTRMYVCTAIGGVWRSDDGGRSWTSTMDGFDLDPQAFAAVSLASGAIAVDPVDPDRVYVGTGEGDTDALFANRITNALPAYRGVGPIRSDDGGQTWAAEPSSPSLAGFSFFQIAVNPGDREHCVAATTGGLYERVPAPGGGFEWQRRRTGRHSSVVAVRAGGVTRWFAAEYPGGVVTSLDGNAWSAAGTGFPATNVGRIALGAQRDNPNVLYALVANAAGSLHSVQRLDGAAGAWRSISGTPPLLPGGQGDYDLCIAVDPNNANRIYMGGDYFNDGTIYPGSIWRGDVASAGATLSMATASIGQNSHADVHVLAFTPGDSNALWAGCDGGLFLNTAPGSTGSFAPRNTGLGTLATNYFGQHPLEPAVLYVGLQDNGTAKSVGEMVWRHVLFADGGYCVVNWNDPFRVLLFANGNVFRATDGGLDYGSWTTVTPPGAAWVTMAEPLVGTPVNTAAPAEANIVALGAGNGGQRSVYISSDFGTTWPVVVNLPAGSGSAISMVFASAARLFVGTTNGRVFRLDRGGSGWTATRIDNASAGPLGLAGLISDIAIDWTDATLGSIYICFGGTGDVRHVWRFDGSAWQARSGTAGGATTLLDVEHNAIQVDRSTGNVYVGADIGAWESTDGGLNWQPLANGLPDAPVFDLQFHPTQRLLRASLHGRGLWEWKLDAPIQRDVELYVRDTLLDTARGTNTDGRPDPSVPPGSQVFHYLSPNIKVDVPTPAGYQTPTTDIDFLTFNDALVDGSNGVGTNAPPPTVHNRVYVEVHNRGRVDATNVQVMAVLTNASAGLGPLPSGYEASVVAGTPLPGPNWTTLGVQTIPVLRAGFPRVVAFDLPSTVLPMPASLPGQSHYCLVTFVHDDDDPFTSTQTNVDLLTLADRKVGQKNLHIVEFIGTPPASGIGMWAMLLIEGAFFRERGLFDLVVDARGFPGDLHLVLPPPIFPRDLRRQAEGFRSGTKSTVKTWFSRHRAAAERLFHEAKYPERQYGLLVESMQAVAEQTPLVLKGGGKLAAIRSLDIAPGARHAVFFRIDPPAGAKPGARWHFDVLQRDTGSGDVLGGSRYEVVVNRPAR